MTNPVYFRTYAKPDYPGRCGSRYDSRHNSRDNSRDNGRKQGRDRSAPRPYARRSRPVLSRTAVVQAPDQQEALPSRQQLAASPRPQRRSKGPKALLAGGSIAMLAVLAVSPSNFKTTLQASLGRAAAASPCETVVQSTAQLSRDQLSRFLAIPGGSSKTAVRRVMQSPYCVLQRGSAASGGVREAYPLAFDLQTWLVVDYQDDAYAGYDFMFRP